MIHISLIYLTLSHTLPSSLQILEQIESVHVANVNTFSFGRHLERSLPRVKEAILRRVIEEVNEWFLLMRERAPEIGAFAMAQTEAVIVRQQRETQSRYTRGERERERKRTIEIFRGLER